MAVADDLYATVEDYFFGEAGSVRTLERTLAT